MEMQAYMQRSKESITPKEVFSTIGNYRYSLIVILIVSLLVSAYIAYATPPVYQASVLAKTNMESRGYYEDFLRLATGSPGREINDDLVIMKSAPVIERAIEKLHLGTRYYVDDLFYEKERYYTEVPFQVTHAALDATLQGEQFLLSPVDRDHFRLVYPKPNTIFKTISAWFTEKKDSFTYNKIHRYGEPIHTPKFTFKIVKKAPKIEREYRFSIVPDKKMISFLQNGLGASRVNKYGYIISVTFEDTVAKRAADIVNAVVDAYIDVGLEFKSKGAKQQLYFMDIQLEAIEKTMKGSAQELESYKSTNVVVNLSTKAQSLTQKLSKVESQIYEVSMKLDMLNDMLSRLNRPKGFDGLSLDSTLISSMTVRDLVTRLQKTMADFNANSVEFAPGHPKVRKQKVEIMYLRRSLKETLLSEIKTQKNKKTYLQEEVKRYKTQISRIPEQEKQLAQLTRHFMVNEKIYTYLLRKREEVAIVAASTISNTHVVESASIPGTPIKPLRQQIILIGLLIGFLLGIAQAFLRQFLDDKINTKEEIERITDLSLYGQLPYVKEKGNMVSYYKESLRSFWINLSFVQSEKRSKIITLTSMVSGEGKTFTAYYLGRMIAKGSAHRVVIVDMDMRKPSMHERFKMTNNEAGVSTVLRGSYDAVESCRKTEYENLDVLLSGPKAPNPTKLIMSDELQKMFDELSKKYDYIIIDTSPIGLISDALKIMRHSDLTLFLLKVGFSEKSYLKEIERYSKEENLEIGIVLNGIEAKRLYGHYNKGVYAYHNYLNESNDKPGTL